MKTEANAINTYTYICANCCKLLQTGKHEKCLSLLLSLWTLKKVQTKLSCFIYKLMSSCTADFVCLQYKEYQRKRVQTMRTK